LSKLTDYQLRSMIERLETSAASREAREGLPAVDTRRRLERYRQEMRDRDMGLSVAEPQADRRG
jgi:hypothetical protein